MGGGSNGYWTDSVTYGTGSYAGLGSDQFNPPNTYYGSMGSSGAGYYSEEYGSGEFLGGSSPNIIHDILAQWRLGTIFKRFGRNGYYAGDGDMYQNLKMSTVVQWVLATIVYYGWVSIMVPIVSTVVALWGGVL